MCSHLAPSSDHQDLKNLKSSRTGCKHRREATIKWKNPCIAVDVFEPIFCLFIVLIIPEILWEKTLSLIGLNYISEKHMFCSHFVTLYDAFLMNGTANSGKILNATDVILSPWQLISEADSFWSAVICMLQKCKYSIRQDIRRLKK